jgi:hypothetical protein
MFLHTESNYIQYIQLGPYVGGGSQGEDETFELKVCLLLVFKTYVSKKRRAEGSHL